MWSMGVTVHERKVSTIKRRRGRLKDSSPEEQCRNFVPEDLQDLQDSVGRSKDNPSKKYRAGQSEPTKVSSGTFMVLEEWVLNSHLLGVSCRVSCLVRLFLR